MIQQEELRIGNKAKVNEVIRTVCGIGDFICFENGDIYHPDEIEPIPLTEEILLKCGFSKRSDGKFEIGIQDYGYVLDFLDWRNGGEWSLGIEYYDPIDDSDLGHVYPFNGKGLKHLHQLQNLYFALTEKELEVKL